MKDYYYYRALRKTIVQFLDLFNDIKIDFKAIEDTKEEGYQPFKITS